MSFLIGAEFFDKCVDLLGRVFSSQLVIAAVTLGGLFVFFLLCLFFARISGDYNKNRKAVKMIARGEIESGLKRLGRFAPAFDKLRYTSPTPSDFDYDKIISHPHSYSLLKRLPMLVLGMTLFFAALAVAAASSLPAVTDTSEVLDSFAALMLLAVSALGLILFVISVLISGKALKKGTKRYHAMIDFVKDITVTSVAIIEESTIDGSAEKLCMQIELLAVSGGADYMTLSDLHLQISELMQRATSEKTINRLTAALDVVDLLIDSAMPA